MRTCKKIHLVTFTTLRHENKIISILAFLIIVLYILYYISLKYTYICNKNFYTSLDFSLNNIIQHNAIHR